jgi:hypothetical protein
MTRKTAYPFPFRDSKLIMKSKRNPMKRTLALAFLPHALPGFALTPVLAQTSTPGQTMAAATLTMHRPCGRFGSSRNTNSRPLVLL